MDGLSGPRTNRLVAVGSGPFRYRVEETWTIPSNQPCGVIVGVACDGQNRIFLFARGTPPVMVLDCDRKLLTCWGEGLFARTHGIFIGPDDTVYCTDDFDHTLRVFTSPG